MILALVDAEALNCISQVSTFISTWLSQRQLKVNRFNTKVITYLLPPKSGPLSLWTIHPVLSQIFILNWLSQARFSSPFTWIKAFSSYRVPTCSLMSTSISSLCPSQGDWVEVLRVWLCTTLPPKPPNTVWVHNPHTHTHSSSHKYHKTSQWLSNSKIKTKISNTTSKPLCALPTLPWPDVVLFSLCVPQPYELSLGHIILL